MLKLSKYDTFLKTERLVQELRTRTETKIEIRKKSLFLAKQKNSLQSRASNRTEPKNENCSKNCVGVNTVFSLKRSENRHVKSNCLKRFVTISIRKVRTIKHNPPFLFR